MDNEDKGEDVEVKNSRKEPVIMVLSKGANETASPQPKHCVSKKHTQNTPECGELQFWRYWW